MRMTDKTKKIIVITLIILVLFAIGFILYAFFKKPAGGESPGNVGFFDFVSSFFSSQDTTPGQETGDSGYTGDFSTSGNAGQNVFDVGTTSGETGAGVGTVEDSYIFDENASTSDEYIFGYGDGFDIFQEIYVMGDPAGKALPRLYHIVDRAIAGMTVMKNSPKNNIVARFMERATGHVYNVETARIRETRITKTTIPAVHSALFSQDGRYVVAQYLDDSKEGVETFVGTVPTTYTSGGGALSGKFLPKNSYAISLSPAKNDVFFMLKTPSGAAGYVAPLSDTTRRTQVFSFPLSEWLAVWQESARINIVTKPSSGIPGYSYNISSAGSAGMERVLGGISGLTALPNRNGSYTLIGSASGGSMTLSVRDEKTKTASTTILSTLPEKCVWKGDNVTFYCAVPSSSFGGSLPDSWYQGASSFSDEIYEMNAKNGVLYYTALIDGIDATNLTLSPDGRLLFFTDKNDSTLWVLNLTLTGDRD